MKNISLGFGIGALLAHPEHFKPQLPDLVIDRDDDEPGWSDDCQRLLDTLYNNSGIGNTTEERIKFWVDQQNDPHNISMPQDLGVYETIFVLGLYPDQAHTC